MARRSTTPVPDDVTLLTDDDIYLFAEGSHVRLYDKLGAHLIEHGGTTGVYFAVWAPNAEHVSVTGDFNDWEPRRHPLRPRADSGIWEGFIPGIDAGARYKYRIESRHHGYRVDKADPLAFFSEVPPATASIVATLDYEWQDTEWMASRRARSALDAPMSIYEVHLGSWMRVPEDNYRSLSYAEMADRLVAYVKQVGYTHVEFLPVMEHPFFGSWGYQVTGFFAPTSRFGSPQEFMALVDRFHQEGIGVILDWVPSHFPNDEHGLIYFDGTHLYEHQDPRKGYHPDWNSAIFNYGRDEVRSFLISSALFWLDKYHVDGLRVDAVASMLYLDYSRAEGEWIPNEYGGRENLEALAFLRRLNEDVYRHHPDVQTIAEESTAWPMVSRPVYVGGLGFGLKWDMGWMHDTLQYLHHEPVHRRYHHNELTFRAVYAFNENFVLPLSHDEVVHGKGSLLGGMPGDDWQKFANLRLLYAYMYAEPGKKLLFMGGDIGQWAEWNHDAAIEWHLLDHEPHRGIQRFVGDLNRLYREEPALHQLDCDPAGFAWVDCNDADQSTVTFLRRSRDLDDLIVVACNFTPVPRHNFRIGVPRGDHWKEILNTDAPIYGGSGQGNLGGVDAVPVAMHGHPFSLTVTLPPLAAIYFQCERSSR